ncbi:MAG: thioredoxin family protein [Sphingobacteriales bacterium]|nr:thioredoxin family protein [Sphingobacteriales bacterium]
MMKKIFPFLIIPVIFFSSVTAQVQYEVSKDAKTGLKVLKGVLSIDILKNDTSFHWMTSDISWYKPKPEVLTNLTAVKDSVYIVALIGTWCEDSHYIFPQLLKMLGQAAFNMNRLTIIGIDRPKVSITPLSAAFGLKKTPTILLFKNGKEIGRVEEYGKYGIVDQELAEIFAKAK